MPIFGYQIETEHTPIDSTALDWSGNVLFNIYFQVISPGIAKKFVFHVSKTNVQVCVHISKLI